MGGCARVDACGQRRLGVGVLVLEVVDGRLERLVLLHGVERDLLRGAEPDARVDELVCSESDLHEVVEARDHLRRVGDELGGGVGVLRQLRDELRQSLGQHALGVVIGRLDGANSADHRAALLSGGGRGRGGGGGGGRVRGGSGGILRGVVRGLVILRLHGGEQKNPNNNNKEKGMTKKKQQ